MSEHISAVEAQALLDAATPGPWVRPSATSNWFTVHEPVQIDEADWGPEAQERGLFGYRVGTLADERAWRYGDVELMAAAPRLAAEVVRLRQELDAARAELAQLAVDERCSCGWGVVHDPDNPRCDRPACAARLLGGGE